MQRRQFLAQLGIGGGAVVAGALLTDVGRTAPAYADGATTTTSSTATTTTTTVPTTTPTTTAPTTVPTTTVPTTPTTTDPAVTTAATPTGPVVYVPAPTGVAATDTAAIQDAINGSPTGSIIVFSPTVGGVGYVVDATIVLLAQRSYIGSDRTATVIQAAPGSDLPAVLAGQTWWESWDFAGLPFLIENLTIDGNKANNTATNGGHGLIFQNYRVVVSNVFVQNTPGSGIVLADANKSGKICTNSLIENRILDCSVTAPGQYGIWVQDHDDSGKCTDGYLRNCVVDDATLDSIKVDRSSGWFITGNHVYTCQGNGIMMDQFWCTYCYDNEVDGFGLAGAAGTTYYGIGIQNVIYDRPGELHNNIVATLENPNATGYHYYYAHLATGIAATLVTSNNTAYRDEPTNKAAAKSIGFEYNSIAPDTFTVLGHLTNLSFGPTTALLIDGGGNVAFDDPLPSHAATHSAGGTDPVSLAGIASTFAPSMAVSGAKSPGQEAALFAQFLSWGVTTTTGLRMVVATSSGNISIGTYGSKGSGTAQVPAALKSTSGAVPCPAVGLATLSLGSAPVTIDQFDFAGLSVDNNDALFAGSSALNVLMTAGLAAYAVHSHPLPATAAASNGSTQIPWIATP